MGWTVALGAPDPALRALVGERRLAPVEQADVVLWPAHAVGPMPVGAVLNVVDLRGADPARVARPEGAGLLLVGSAASYGAWAGLDVPIAVVPPVAAAAGAPGEAFAALHLLVGRALAVAEDAADWAAARGMACGVAEGPLAAVARFGAAPALAPGAVVLDLRGGAGRTEASPALLAALAAGAPVLFLEDTPLRLTLEAAGAGWACATAEAGLARVAGLGSAAFGRASAAAQGFVTARFGAAAAAAAFERAVEGALARVAAQAEAWARLGPGGHVLVVSDEGPNLLHIRVRLPFDELVRRGAIEGYSVLSRGQIVAGAGLDTPGLRFRAIWVQRSVDPLVQLLLRVLGRAFVYDLDDHLLVSPSYRPAFGAEQIEVAAALVRDCAVLSCATGRLAGLLPGGGKTVVTPNLAYGAPAPVAGAARVVVWASSDAPALAESRAEIERAVRDFCRAHGLGVLCLGRTPPALFAAAGLAVEHVGLLPYPAYLARLRAAAPGILVAPLETGADRVTQAFVDAKSDVKAIEAALAGLQGVFSRAAPYADSDLAPAILCDNDYESWLDGLERARLACASPAPAAAWPARRDAAGAGPMPWAAALRRAAVDVPAADVEAALGFVRAQGETLLGAPALFDEADYLRRHADVAAAVADGIVASGYRHFVQSGFREGRAVRRVETPEGAASFWWSRLLHELSVLEVAVPEQGRAIAGLRDRAAVRRWLPDPASVAVPAPVSEAAPAMAGWSWGVGEPRSLPCPVCDAAGPHAVVVQAGATVLLGCAACGSRFSEDRRAHDYADEAAVDVLLQLTLEQNASIHHQTRLLFAHEGGGSVLDVGCGFGFAVDLARTVLGWRAVGVDPSWAAAAGRRQLGADLRQEMLTAKAALGDGFDRVIASEVIEHVADPHALLATLRSRLVPGGVLLLTTPNAAAVAPGADRGRLLGIVAPGVHLTLFTAGSLAGALRRAGFAHVAVEEGADTLVASASDWPLGAGAEAGHGPAYRAYLEGLLERAEPGGALWNGAAGRLYALLAETEALDALHALFARIAAAWREAFGIDLLRLRLPATGEAGLRAAALGARQPFDLAGVLLSRALVERRLAGSTPEGVLAYARPAFVHAVETRRVLQAENMVDLDLKRTAWRARLLMVDCLAALAPELEGTLLRGVAEGSPGELADWADAPEGALLARLAPFFTATVAAGAFDEAGRVERWMAALDRLVEALADQPAVLLPALLAVGVQRMAGRGDPAGALPAFELLATEARRCLAAGHEAFGRDYLGRAAAQMAAAQMAEAQMAAIE